MHWYMAIIFICLGAVLGSFLNVVIDRIPIRQSIVYPPSRCNSCLHRLNRWDLIPIFSFIWLKGKCRYCGKQIPPRILLVEIISAIVFLLIYLQFNISWSTLIMAVYACAFMVLSFIDIENQVLPDVIVYFMMPIAFVLFVFYGHHMPGVVINLWDWGMPYSGNAVLSFAGGICGFVLLLVVALVAFKFLKREGMGGGDIKLTAMLGLMLGFPLVLAALYIAIISGAIIVSILVLAKQRKWTDPVAFGPYLCLGAMVTLLYGNQMLGWLTI